MYMALFCRFLPYFSLLLRIITEMPCSTGSHVLRIYPHTWGCFPKIRIAIAEFFCSLSAGSHACSSISVNGGCMAIGLCYTYAYNYTLSLYITIESHRRFSYDMSKHTYWGMYSLCKINPYR